MRVMIFHGRQNAQSGPRVSVKDERLGWRDEDENDDEDEEFEQAGERRERA